MALGKLPGPAQVAPPRGDLLTGGGLSFGQQEETMPREEEKDEKGRAERSGRWPGHRFAAGPTRGQREKHTVLWQLWMLGPPFLKTQWQLAPRTTKAFKPSTWGPASRDFVPCNSQRKENILVTASAAALFVIRRAKHPQCQGN